MSSSAIFREDYAGQTEHIKVDSANSIVRNVKILGWKSRNRRTYVPEGVDASLYEGKFVNADHFPEAYSAPPGGLPANRVQANRSVFSRFARLVGVTKKADGLYADKLVCNPKHPFTEQFLWWAENHPDAIVLSHLAGGPSRHEKDGTVTVLKIDQVISVDAVGTGGTNATLYESLIEMDPKLEAGEYLLSLFPETALDEIKTKLTAALQPPAEFTGDVNAALAELQTSADPRVRIVAEAYNERLAKDARLELVTKAKTACQAARLPEPAITQIFVESLADRPEADWAKHINDRKIGLAQTAKPPVSGGADVKPTADDFVKGYRKGN
jgi:hypothetical protein